MAIMNLTEARIRELEYGSGIWRDEQVKGLMVVCHATTKTYAVQGDVRTRLDQESDPASQAQLGAGAAQRVGDPDRAATDAVIVDGGEAAVLDGYWRAAASHRRTPLR